MHTSIPGLLVLSFTLFACNAAGAAKPKATPVKSSAKSSITSKAAPAKTAKAKKKPRLRRSSGSQWSAPNYVTDATDGDQIDGEDLVVRRAAVEALGNLNGSVLVSDANTGRILTIVNQKLAFRSGYTPCSTIKVMAALAGLQESLIDRSTPVKLSRWQRMDLTEALAVSNNPYFARIGLKLGYDRLTEYARTFGLGEKAGLGIPEEQAGTWPAEPPAGGGLGMMTSFGQGITITPLQLGAMMGALANGGTLLYLQHPRSVEEVQAFVPRVKRHLDIEPLIPEVKPGMMGAVEFGTARRAAYDPNEPLFGKTGTCTDFRMPTHLGWFASFNEVGKTKLFVVVMLTGGKAVSGPVASGIAGGIYRTLSRQNYFQQLHAYSPSALVSAQSGAAQ
jgi:penicillin-binding protein 2